MVALNLMHVVSNFESLCLLYYGFISVDAVHALLYVILLCLNRIKLLLPQPHMAEEPLMRIYLMALMRWLWKPYILAHLTTKALFPHGWQVVFQQLWSIELAFVLEVRNMEDLENPREVPAVVNLSSSDERVIFDIAEVNLADILDMNYEDFLTFPDKRLSCYAVAKLPDFALNNILNCIPFGGYSVENKYHK